MTEYVYPALFHQNDDSSITITFPDLQGCISEGKSIGNALYMAQSALNQWLLYLKDNKVEIPTPSDPSHIRIAENEFVNLIRVEIKDGRAIKRTVSIPKWMDDEVSSTGLSLSKVLQEALVEKFNNI